MASRKASGTIYGISCSENGRVYVGSTVDFARRTYLHRRLLERNKHHSPRLQNAWNKYGADAFSFIVLETVDDAVFLTAREQFWMWRNDGALLNCSKVAGSPLGVRRSEETKARQVVIKKAYYATDIGKSQLEAMHAKLRGRVVSAEERAMRSSALKGRPMGRVWTDEARAAHSIALTGRKMPPVSDETRRAISNANRGRKHTAESIQKSIASRLSYMDGEAIEWLRLWRDGKSFRDIEKMTGRDRSVISREVKLRLS